MAKACQQPSRELKWLFPRAIYPNQKNRHGDDQLMLLSGDSQNLMPGD
ncbi:MAG: hypothetical protein ACI8WM_000901 [Burkholderiaceae bacterium]|jgi:hypothetical protein